MRTLLLLAMLPAVSCAGARDTWMGANVKESVSAPWGSAAAARSMKQLADAGAGRALLVAFVWQDGVASNHPVLGEGSDPKRIGAGLRQMRRAGLEPVLKVHLWTPGHWAGEAQPQSPAIWFEHYGRALLQLADVAEKERAAALVVGTELRGLEDAPQWIALVKAVRERYRGPLLYVTDNLEQAERFPHWALFDIIGASLYPSLPAEPQARQQRMRESAARLVALGQRWQRPVWAAEVGLRSSAGSLAAPWESPEQREDGVDLALQRQVLSEWRDTLRHPGIDAMVVWCWYTDPRAGGPHDTDFTVQNKPAQEVLAGK